MEQFIMIKIPTGRVLQNARFIEDIQPAGKTEDGRSLYTVTVNSLDDDGRYMQYSYERAEILEWEGTKLYGQLMSMDE